MRRFYPGMAVSGSAGPWTQLCYGASLRRPGMLSSGLLKTMEGWGRGVIRVASVVRSLWSGCGFRPRPREQVAPPASPPRRMDSVQPPSMRLR